jgi:RecB family exonuclease
MLNRQWLRATTFLLLAGLVLTGTAEASLFKKEGTPDQQRAEMIESAFRVLDDDRFAPVFGSGSRPEVALTGSVGTVAVSGRMDRLVVTPERVLVIDYKTNRPAPARIEDADPAYVRQLAVYAAISQGSGRCSAAKTAPPRAPITPPSTSRRTRRTVMPSRYRAA